MKLSALALSYSRRARMRRTAMPGAAPSPGPQPDLDPRRGGASPHRLGPRATSQVELAKKVKVGWDLNRQVGDWRPDERLGGRPPAQSGARSRHSGPRRHWTLGDPIAGDRPPTIAAAARR